MQSDENRSKLMVASYMGGAAIATSYVGLVHPFSAGLSVALGLHHCVANCMTMRAMEEFYKNEYDEFWLMTKTQSIDVPKINHSLLSANQYDALYEAAIVHEKPLTNALGTEFKTVLTKDKVIELFKMM
jgi:3-deoxy-alpha-D-manno-octulosonate 8-oxidase